MQLTRMSAYSRLLTRTATIAAACAAALLPTMAHAQLAQTNTSASIRLGAYIPSNGDTQKAFGKTFFNAGLDYYFQQTGDTERAMVSVDYFERSGGGTRLQVIPVTVGQQFIYSARAHGVRPYFGYGIGAYFVEAKNPHDTNIVGAANGGGGNDTADDTEFGGYADVGADLTSNIFVDARYHIVTPFKSVNTDGLVLSAGVRF